MPASRPHKGFVLLEGFTLLEVMIALAVFSIAAVGFSKVLSQNIQGMSRLEEKTIAHWVGKNELVQMRATAELPVLTTTNKKVEMAGREWLVTRKVIKASLAGFQRVDVEVGRIEGQVLSEKVTPLAVLTTYVGDKNP